MLTLLLAFVFHKCTPPIGQKISDKNEKVYIFYLNLLHQKIEKEIIFNLLPGNQVLFLETVLVSW